MTEHLSPQSSGGTVLNAQPLLDPMPPAAFADTPSPALATRIDSLWSNAFTADALPSVTIRTDSLAGDAPPPTFGSPTLTLKTRTLSEPGQIMAEAAEYELRQSIGQGGMAVVYEARQMAIDRTIALKMIKPDYSGEDLYRERFLYEAAVTGDLEHPNIIPIYDLGTNAQGQPFYAMRRIRGTPWTKVMQEKPLLENIAILMDVADAVAFAHSRGVLHRDLKPDNVMLGEYGEVLLIDWGIAVSFTEEGKAPRLSEATALGGTPSYMAPEMAAGDVDRIGTHSDIYLLGAILYEIVTGQKPHPGKSLREVLLNAAQNVITPPARKDELLEIALQAMATEPADRAASVKVFQESIREHLSHAESIAFSSRAQAILERARASGSYDEFGQALFTVQEALKLWEGNRAARQGLDAARLAWAECACAKGDLDLAEAQLEAGGLGGSELGARVRQLKAERRRIADEVRALENQLASEAHREWTLVFEDDFIDPDVERRWELVGGQWEWHPGELRVRGGRPQFIIGRTPIDGDIRVEFECRQEGDLLSDVNCFLAAPPDDDRGELDEQAYAFRIGAEGNRHSGIYRLAKPLYQAQGAALKAGRRLRVRAERVGGRLTLTVNGRVICDLIDPEPLAGEGRGVWGLAGWCAETIYTVVRVWRLGSPLKVDLLQWAEKYLARGRYETAIDLFEDVAGSTAAPERIARARQGLERAAALRDLHQRMPELERRLTAVWPGARLRLGDDGLCLSIDQQEVEDLSPLAGIALADLECEGNRITSLEPLRGMPLRRLICKNNAIESLEPLRGMPLRVLNFSGNRVSDLAPLAGMPLTILLCFNNRIESLESLRGMSLHTLAFFYNRVDSLEPLRGMPLAALGCAGNRVKSLEPLRGLPLNAIWCSSNEIENLEPLRGMALVNLFCSHNRIASLEPLRGMPLNSLWCENNLIARLDPVAGLPLDTLHCFNNPLTSLAPLFANPPRDFLYSGTALEAAELARAAEAWAALPAGDWHARGAEALQAFMINDAARLRSLAAEFQGRRYAYVPLCVPFAEAASRCRDLGGTLANIDTLEKYCFIHNLIHDDAIVWVDAPSRSGEEEYMIGNPYRYHAHAAGLNATDIGYRLVQESPELWAVQPSLHRLFPFVIELP